MRESLKYLHNAKEILKKAPIEDNRYVVKDVLKAANAFIEKIK